MASEIEQCIFGGGRPASAMERVLKKAHSAGLDDLLKVMLFLRVGGHIEKDGEVLLETAIGSSQGEERGTLYASWVGYMRLLSGGNYKRAQLPRPLLKLGKAETGFQGAKKNCYTFTAAGRRLYQTLVELEAGGAT